MSLSNEIKNINVDYAFSYEDVLQYAAEMAGKREAELLDEISRLRAVIDEIPEEIECDPDNPVLKKGKR